MADEQSRVLTLVFTDLVDSTALKTARGDQAVGELITRHREHVTRLAGESSGRVIDWAGDGCFLTFETSSAAVMFGLRLQQVHGEDAELPGVRVGVHMGEVTEKIGPDGVTPRVEGLAVDLAARIQGLARPGQVLMSSSVYQSARQRLGVDTFGTPLLWQAHGNYTLKGYDDPMDICEAGLEGLSPLQAPGASEKAQPLVPVSTPEVEIIPPRSGRNPTVYTSIAIVVVVLIAAGSYYFGSRQDGESADIDSREAITSLAVLPFDNLMNDPEQDYFVDGMTDALIAELAKIRSLKVISRTSAMRYKDTNLSLTEIARELGVDALVEGSVLKVENEVRITAQLIDGRTDEHLWADNFDSELENVLKLHSDVALAIAKEVQAIVTPEEQKRLTETRPVISGSYDALLRGRYALTEQTDDGFDHAFKYFSEAIRLDSESAAAHADLSIAYTMSHIFEWIPAEESIREGRRAANAAMVLDSRNPKAKTAAGWVALAFDWDWEEAERYFKDAYAINPNDAATIYGLVWVTMLSGRIDEALDIARRGVDTDRFSLQAHDHLGDINLTARRFDDALDAQLETLRQFPEHMIIYVDTIWSYAGLGQYEDGLESANRVLALNDSEWAMADGIVAYAYALAGRGEEARERIDTMLTQYRDGRQSPFGLAIAYGALGDLEEGFKWLHRAESERAGALLIASWPVFDPFRDDPRFTALLRRMNHPILEWMPPDSLNDDAPIEKIAVLPFDNMSSDPEQEYFVDGMTEALIAELAKIKSIRVISRTSIMQYKDTVKSLPEIARELGVDALVEGSVMKAGNDVRITAQLVHGITDEHLWADSYTNTLENVFKLQAEVALAITDEINAVVTPEEESRITSANTVDPEAYRLYTQGKHFVDLRTAEGMKMAQGLFERAVEIDPGFALPHAGIAEVFGLQPTLGMATTAEAIPLAVAAAQRALAIDPNLGEAYATLGRTMVSLDWDWSAAESAFLRAIELSPGFATAYAWYGRLLSQTGRDEKAVDYSATAYQLDPLSPNVAGMYCRALLYAGQVELGLRQFEEADRLHSESAIFNFFRGSGLIHIGEFEAAARYLDRGVVLGNDEIPIIGALGVPVRAMTGDHDGARAGLEQLIEESDNGKETTQAIVWTYAALGDVDSALEWFERGIEGHESGIESVPRFGDPFMESLKTDPRYIELLRRMNYPDLEDAH